MLAKISVIIPVYNAEKFLSQCINSVLSQSLRSIEVICVDDCSTDSSIEIINTYIKKDPRIRLFQNSSNMHAGICRNIGLTYAKGEYVLFLDADDWLLDYSLEKLYEEATSKSADIIRCRSLDFDNVSGNTSKGVHNYLKRIPFFLFSRSLCYKNTYWLFSKINVAPWGGLFKRSFLFDNNIRFNDLICVNDRSFFWESIIKAKTIVFSKTVLLNYRMNISSSLIGNRIKNFDCHFISYELVYQLSKNLPLRMRRNVLNAEMLDMINWLELAGGSCLMREIISSYESFVSSMQQDIWGGKANQTKWGKRIARLKRDRQI